MAECQGRLDETLPGAFVCSQGRDCAVLPWVLSYFATGGPRVKLRVRVSHPNRSWSALPEHVEVEDMREAILNAFEPLAEDVLDKQKPALPPYLLRLVEVAAKRMGDDPIAYLAGNRIDAQVTHETSARTQARSQK